MQHNGVIVAGASSGETKMWAAVRENGDFLTVVNYFTTVVHKLHNFGHAMRSIRAAIAVARCLSVCLSVTFVSCAKTNKDIFKIFSPSGSQTILVCTYLKPKQLIIKDCARRFVLKLYRHKASHGLFATAELLVSLVVFYNACIV